MKKNDIKIDQTEIDHFPLENITIDPYWEDLYNPSISKKNKKTHEKYDKKTKKILFDTANNHDEFCFG